MLNPVGVLSAQWNFFEVLIVTVVNLYRQLADRGRSLRPMIGWWSRTERQSPSERV